MYIEEYKIDVMNESIALGIDIGGSHITAALVNVTTGTVFTETCVRSRVDSHESADEIISIWKNVINEAFSKMPIAEKRIGIAMPGPFDYEKGISLIKGVDKYESLYGLNLKERLADALNINKQNISFSNDAACFLQGEVTYGAVNGFNSVVGVTLGSGAGSACYFNGTVEEGNLWRLPFRDATVDEYLSTRWFIKRYFEITGQVINDVKALCELVPQDSNAVQIFNEFGNNLGNALHAFIKDNKPEVVIIGGNISKSWDLFIDEARKVLKAKGILISIEKASLGEDAALLGAVAFGKNILTEV